MRINRKRLMTLNNIIQNIQFEFYKFSAAAKDATAVKMLAK